MIWNINQIRDAIKTNINLINEDKFHVPLFDPIKKIGIGTQGTNKVVFISRAQDIQFDRETKKVKFNPKISFTWEEKSVVLNDMSILVCEIDKNDEEVLDAVCAIFFGLLELSTENKEIGSIVIELMDLFDSGFKSKPSENLIIGLMGELVFINSTNNLDELINAWHVKTNSTFDFSVENRRLEVKTTTNSKRVHKFSSSQIITLTEIDIKFVSIILPLISLGDSISTLYSKISSRIDAKSKSKLYEIICKTLKYPPEMVKEPNFDVESAEDSLKYFRPNQIPTPSFVPGIINMNWTAELTDLEGEKNDEILSWFFNS